MDLEDRYHFEIDTGYEDYSWLTLSCTRCTWSSSIDELITLADLEYRAENHVETCPGVRRG